MQYQDLLADLQRTLGKDQVQFDPMTRLLYSTDASQYQIMPIGVTFPRHDEDVEAIHAAARQYDVPILPRGAGTSLAGQGVNAALIMDFSRHMKRVRGINAEAHSITVEPGMVIDHINQQVAPLGLMLGPDPASANRATVGGCIANNSTGSHSILYGMMADHVRRVEVVFASGERAWLDANTPMLNSLREAIATITRTHQAEIQQRFPKTWRNVAGYALNKINPDQPDLKWLIAGSEGTLGTITAAELNLVPVPAQRRLALLHFDTLRESLETTPRILEVSPSAVELIDRFLLNKTRENAHFAPLLTGLIHGDPAAVLVVEFYGDNDAELTHKINTLTRHLQHIGFRGEISHAVKPVDQARVWTVRKAGLGLLLSQRGDTRPIEFIEDAAVPVEHLADYISDVEAIIRAEDTTFAIYAHASAGCLHLRPLINLKTVQGAGQYRRIAEAVADLVVKYGGTTTGEHGEGIVRGEFNRRLFGDQLVGAFHEVKQAFDPDNRMNPGKLIDPHYRMDDPAIMRYSPDYEVIPVQTRFDWSTDFGISGAAEMCNGSAVCRKIDMGTMCPSYMVTLDEAHSTRGRANALRQALTGKLDQGLASHDLYEVYELCLACKACQSECPSSVDAARMKAEFLAAYHDAHGTPLAARLFGNVHRLNAIGSHFPHLSNLLLNSSPGKWAMQIAGLPTTRPLPRLAKQRFSKSIPQESVAAPAATLIIDTYTEYYHPEIGKAFCKIVDMLGLQVQMMRLPNQGCCGRPAISKGLLDQAKMMAAQNIRWLADHLEQAPFLFLEPSCLSALIDDYQTLVDPTLQTQAKTIAASCLSAEAWLHLQLEQRETPLQWDEQTREILLHGHCHQKALWTTADSLNLLRHIPHATIKEIDSGCCGMAGSFGYEHPEVSLAIANQRLLPTIQKHPAALVAAPGTSCRTQISDQGYRAWHPLEIIAAAL